MQEERPQDSSCYLMYPETQLLTQCLKKQHARKKNKEEAAECAKVLDIALKEAKENHIRNRFPKRNRMSLLRVSFSKSSTTQKYIFLRVMS